MALSAGTVWEVESGASDTANSGGFNPTNINFASDLIATASSGQSSTPTVSSASYTFVAGDVNAWLFIKSGTGFNSNTWYKITGVSAGVATLSAAIGAGVVYNTGNLMLTTVAGVATTASPISGQFAVDYSQQASVQFSGTDLAVDGTVNTKVTSATHTFTKADVGNVIQITAGAGFTTGWYEIVSVTSGAATLDRSPAATSTTGGTWCQGGALATPGKAGAAHVASNTICIKSATYSITSASTNVASGCLSVTTGVAGQLTKVIGYGSVRGDNGTKPIMQGSGISTFTLCTAPAAVRVNNLGFDGNNLTSSRGGSGAGAFFMCKGMNCTNSAFAGGAVCTQCEASGGSGGGSFNSCITNFCTAHGNSNANGFSISSSANDCIAYGNGASGFNINGSGADVQVTNCTSYNNTGAGFSITSSAATSTLINCLAHTNTTFGFNLNSSDSAVLLNCAGYNNTSGTVSSTTLGYQSNVTTLAADPLVAPGSNDFRLSGTAAGMSLRGGGAIAPPGLTNGTSYLDVGALQSQAAAVLGVTGMTGGMQP